MAVIQKSKKYQDIFEAAKSLFWKHGIRRVNIDEICREAGASKMTYYRFFKNKNELAEIVLQNILDEGYRKYRAIMGQDIPFPEKIKQTILLKHEASADIGDEFLKDVYQSEKTELVNIIRNSREISYNDVMNDLKKAQKEGWIRKDIKLEFMLYMMNSIGDKLFDKTLTAMYPEKHDLIMELTNFYFYGIMKSEN